MLRSAASRALNRSGSWVGSRSVYRAGSRSAEAGKGLRELPGPSPLLSLYWLLLRGYGQRTHLLQVVQREAYGPLWRSSFGGLELVNVACPRLMEQLVQQEGAFPVRVLLPHWKEYRDLRGQPYGLHLESGPGWRRLRGALNPHLLKPKEVWSYAGAVQDVVTDLLTRVEVLRRRHPDNLVMGVASELHKFGLEAVCCVLFERRLGCLQDDVPPDTLRFIAAVDAMLSLSEPLLLLPPWTRPFLSLWQRFVQAWDDLHHLAQTLIDQRVEEMGAGRVRGQEGAGLYLTHLLKEEKLSRDELYVCITELLLGGVDTTSNTLSWLLYRLSRDQRVQRRLHAEVTSVCPGQAPPTVDAVREMPYLKAVVKETLRLYPVVPGNGRLVSENEVILENYRFPKKTQFHLCHYAVCRDPAHFPDADGFVPERWLRAEAPAGRFLNPPYSFVPFGVGVRGCVGKRLAEMEMHLALSRLVQHYHFLPDEGAPPVEPRTRTLLVPGSPINLHFVPRS